MNIVDIARGYLKQEEVRGNKGFKDPNFDKEMRSVGFQTGYPWCAVFVKLVWKKAGQVNYKLISPGVVETMRNFHKAGRDLKYEPKVGSIFIFRSYVKNKEQGTGHTGIVTGVGNGYFETVEGNSNDGGGREGYIVASHKRYYTNWTESDGLRLMGFIHPE